MRNSGVRNSKYLNLREEAEKLYVSEGYSLPKIKEKLGIEKRGLLEKWSERNEWTKKRIEFKDSLAKLAYTRLSSQLESSINRYAACASMIALMAYNAIIKLQEIEGTNLQNSEKGSLKKLMLWINIIEKASRIHKNIIPDIDDRVAENMIEEMRALNKKLGS